MLFFVVKTKMVRGFITSVILWDTYLFLKQAMRSAAASCLPCLDMSTFDGWSSWQTSVVDETCFLMFFVPAFRFMPMTMRKNASSSQIKLEREISNLYGQPMFTCAYIIDHAFGIHTSVESNIYVFVNEFVELSLRYQKYPKTNI